MMSLIARIISACMRIAVFGSMPFVPPIIGQVPIIPPMPIIEPCSRLWEVEPEGLLFEAPDAAMPTALAPRNTPEIINVLTIFAFMVFSESD